MLALVFPGQGSQEVGMGSDVYHESAAARAVFESEVGAKRRPGETIQSRQKGPRPKDRMMPMPKTTWRLEAADPAGTAGGVSSPSAGRQGRLSAALP